MIRSTRKSHEENPGEKSGETSMDFDRHRSRQKSAPGSDNDAKYYFSDVGDGGRSKAAKQLRRRKNLDDTDVQGWTQRQRFLLR
ncbi:hypothetical protein TNIN_378771 [Trichonephila inaurata madagascariensis]|uniref:Uncharacterized protein n=1 Tax=Trichonephila inaurata madagascariensis TaxID=2747483 RepID=A0A8X6YWB6_9ARAC|nr:hypothetical protein TNIN_378771 [Trichonephila inaurata madagascariensis]